MSDTIDWDKLQAAAEAFREELKDLELMVGDYVRYVGPEDPKKRTFSRA